MLRNFETSKEKAIKKDFEEKCWSLLEEKILCEKLRGYPILYDKTHKRYKEMVAVETHVTQFQTNWNSLEILDLKIEVADG